MTKTPNTIHVPIISAPVCIAFLFREFLFYADFCRFNRTGGFGFAHISFANQKPDISGQKHQRCDSANPETAAGKKQPQLVNNQSNGISEYRLVSDGEPGPFGIVHLALNGADRRKTGGAQQVKDQERVSGQGSKVLSNGAQFVERAFFHQFQRIAGHSVEYAEHAYYLFLGHQSPR